MYYFNHYVIDWDKVRTLEDMKKVIAALQISFSLDNPNIGNIKEFVRLEKNEPYTMLLIVSGRVQEPADYRS